MQPINAQFYSFLGTVLTGFVLGGLFDFYRVFRLLTKPKKLLTCLGDLLFGLFAALAVFLILLYSNWGEFRLYVFLGMFLGIFFYYNLLSRLVVKVLLAFCRFGKKTAGRGKRMLKKIIRRKKD